MRFLSAALICVLLVSPLPVMADMVIDWNNYALNAIRTASTNPPNASRDLAILQSATHDAVNSICQFYTPYKFPITDAKNASPDAAAAAAGYTVLKSLFPNQSFENQYQASLASLPQGPATDKGVAIGIQVANLTLQSRRNDGSNVNYPYTPTPGPGNWQPTPPANAPFLLPGWGFVTPFAMTSNTQFLQPGPPPLDSDAYAAAFNEVKSLGALNSADRTAYQTETAKFWADGAGTETPPGHWNSIAQTVARSKSNNLVENARLFALVNLAQADAAITAWYMKLVDNFWRPITAIRAADTDGNPNTIADPTWVPLITTPPFPAYTSGHSTFSAASAAVLSEIFGDATAFASTSDGLPGVTRYYVSFSEAASEAGMSRIYGGIHFQFDNFYGLAAGDGLGHYVFLNFITPTGGGYVGDGCNLTFTDLEVDRGGVLNQTGGSLNTTNTIIGDSTGSGTFNQDRGTHTISNALTLAATAGSTGIYNLNNGSLTAALININTGGTFNQTGGAFNTTTMNIYTGGSFNWTGGAFSYSTLNLQGGNVSGNLQNHGLLSGAGTLTGNITNFGIVSPGTFPGVLNIAGSFTQTAAGTYLMKIASTASYGQIKVTGAPGTTSIDGTLTPVLLGGYTPVWNQVFPGIITASNGLDGNFSTINSTFPWLVQFNAARTSLDLRVGGYNFANPSFALTANQRHVGLMLNQVSDAASGDLGTVLLDLALLPTGAVGHACQEISPDKASALPALSLAGSMLQWQSLANRLSYQRWLQGGLPNLAGGRSGSFNLSCDKLAGLMLAYNGADLTGMGSALRPPADSAGTWGVFTDFVSSFGRQDSTANVTGYTFTIFGFTAGADYRLRDDLVIGLGTGYYNTSASYKNSGGDAGISSIPFYAYGAYTPGSFYVMGSLGYTLNLYSLDRTIAFGGINRVATSSPNGNQLNASLETGYDFKVAQVTLTPAFSLYYSQAWVNGFTESGAGALDLNVNSQSADSLQTGLGMRLSRPFQSGSTLILPQIYAFYQHEFANNSRGLDARLAQAGSTFAFQTDSPSRDFAVLGVGVAVGLRKNLTLQANYNAEVGRRNYTPQLVSAGLRYEF